MNKSPLRTSAVLGTALAAASALVAPVTAQADTLPLAPALAGASSVASTGAPSVSAPVTTPDAIATTEAGIGGRDLSAFDPLHIYFLPPRAGVESIGRRFQYLGFNYAQLNLEMSLNSQTASPRPLAHTNASYVGRPLLGPNAAGSAGKEAGVLAADLGIVWDDGTGRNLIAFGDNFGRGHFGATSRFRSSAVATFHFSPETGAHLGYFYTGFEGRAEEMVDSGHGKNFELSKIPTTAISINGVQYADLMSVRRWDEPGTWTTNYSAIYKSYDRGRNWIRTGVVRPNRNGYDKFQMGGFIRHGKYLYELGTPSGRFKEAYVSRVLLKDRENLHEWEYWNGKKWIKNNPRAAKSVIFGGVGELSVQWNPALKRFMLLTIGHSDGIELMYSKDLVHWSQKYMLVPPQCSKIYSPYLLPRQNGRTVYFTLSTWYPYNVGVVRATLPTPQRVESSPRYSQPLDDRPDIIKCVAPKYVEG